MNKSRRDAIAPLIMAYRAQGKTGRQIFDLLGGDVSLKTINTYSPQRQRGKPRMFDRDRAHVLRSQGLSFKEIGDLLGVSAPAVYTALRKDTASGRGVPLPRSLPAVAHDKLDRVGFFAPARRVVRHLLQRALERV